VPGGVAQFPKPHVASSIVALWATSSEARFDGRREAVTLKGAYPYKPKGCEYSVGFPSTPQLHKLSVPVSGKPFEYEQAEAIFRRHDDAGRMLPRAH
jgi:hypothetical protein